MSTAEATAMPSVRAQVASEVKSALLNASHLSAAELLPLCQTAGDVQDLSRVIYHLKAFKLPEGNRYAYRLTTEAEKAEFDRKRDDAKLARHLEGELGASTDLDAESPIGTRLKKARTTKKGDPIIAAIQRMTAPEPRMQEARMHADRLGAMVDRLNAGLPVMPDPDVAAWLADLQSAMVEMA